MSRVAHYLSLAKLDEANALRIVVESANGQPTTVQRKTASQFYIAEKKRFSVRLFEGLKSWLRLATKCLYLSPLLLILKVATRLLGPPFESYGDYLIVPFVIGVVVFFLILSLSVLMHFIVGPRDQREPTQVLQLPSGEHVGEQHFEMGMDVLFQHKVAETAHSRLEAWSRGEAVQGPIRVRGRIVALDDIKAGPILSDRWWHEHDNHWRLFSARPCALIREGAPPVVLAFEAPGWIAGDYLPAQTVENTRKALHLLAHAAEALGLAQPLENHSDSDSQCTLVKQGEMVEVIAEGAKAIAPDSAWARRAHEESMNPDDRPDEASPYRQGPPTAPLLVVSSLKKPLLLRLV